MMTTYVLCALGLAFLAWVMLRGADSLDSDLCALLGVVFGAVSGTGLIAGIVLVFDWEASKVKAKIINAEYGTSYTREDVFYGSSVIDEIRELGRKRIELNGDLMRQGKD